MTCNSENKTEGLLNNLQDRIFSFDTEYKLIFANTPMIADFLKAFGVLLKPGTFILEKVPEPLYSDWHSRYSRVLNGEEFDAFEQFFIDGIPEYVKLSFKPLLDGGKIIGGTCHSRDITQQVQAEKKISQNEQYLHAQINNTKESIWSVDREYRILTLNNVFRNDFNTVFKHELKIGDCVLDYFDGELRAEWKARYDRALAGEHFTKIDKFEFGDFLQYSEVAFNPILVDNEVVGVAGFTKDLTDIVKKQQELEVAVERATAADKLKSAFVANISHEIRSPLNSILGLAELAFDEEYTPVQKAVFEENMLQSGAHLLDVIDSIIDISIIESGQLNLRFAEFELQKLLKTCVEIVQTGNRSLATLIKILPSPKCHLTADERRVKQIIINLLTNAIKFTPRGNITISTAVNLEEVTVSVKDTGVGIDPGVGDDLFKRFYRSYNNRDFAQGTGLGLAISKALVEAMGGRIWYQSRLQHGTTFYFTLPLKK